MTEDEPDQAFMLEAAAAASPRWRRHSSSYNGPAGRPVSMVPPVVGFCPTLYVGRCGESSEIAAVTASTLGAVAAGATAAARRPGRDTRRQRRTAFAPDLRGQS